MIASIFRIGINKSLLTSFVSSIIGNAGATVFGKNIVANLIKLIPGGGTGLGGFISGTTASLLTTALGEAYINVMEMGYKGELKSKDLYCKDGQAMMTKFLKKN